MFHSGGLVGSLVLVSFAALLVAALIPRFSTAFPAMELSASDSRIAELAVERCCSNGNEELAALPAIAGCMGICPVVAMGFGVRMVALGAASSRPQLASWRGLSGHEIESALRPPKGGIRG